MSFSSVYEVSAALLRGETIKGRNVAACYTTVWRRGSRGWHTHKMIDCYEAARAFLKLDRKHGGVKWCRRP